MIAEDDDLISATIHSLEREIDRLRAELAAAKAEPPRPAAIIRVSPRHWEAFESVEDAERWRSEQFPPAPYAQGPTLWRPDAWTWHPKSP